jgi:DNA repair protein RAD5
LQRHSPTQSTKLDALIRHLRILREQEPLTKSVVFSQFTSFLDIVERHFKREKIHYLRLDGSTSQPARAAVLEKFSAHKGRLVLLISLKAGGVGLNLVAASRVFMLDPWWSFAVEAQAIDRIHRVGQNKSVVITRFIVKDSVEEKMLKIQDRKNFVASSLGMSKEEKQAATLEDIKTLFEE